MAAALYCAAKEFELMNGGGEAVSPGPGAGVPRPAASSRPPAAAGGLNGDWMTTDQYIALRKRERGGDLSDDGLEDYLARKREEQKDWKIIDPSLEEEGEF